MSENFFADGMRAKALGQANRFQQAAAAAYTAADPNTRTAALQQAARENTTDAIALDKTLQAQDDSVAAKAAGAAKYVLNAVETGKPEAAEGAYQAVRPFLEKIGAAHGKVPPPNWSPEMLPMLHQVIAASQGGAAAGSVQSTYIDEAGNRVAIMRDGSQKTLGGNVNNLKTTKVPLPDGREGTVTFNPISGKYEVAVIGGIDGAAAAPAATPPAAAPTTGGGATLMGEALVDAVNSTIGQFGGRITSTTGGQHNAGSAHPGGGAVDVGMGQESPERQAQILAALRSNPNLRVTDERQRPPGQAVWSGPHLHVEPVRGSSTPAAAPAGVPAIGMTPAETEAEKARGKAQVELATAGDIEAAKARGKTAAELSFADQQAAAAGAKAAAEANAKADSENAQNASGKMPQINAVQRGLTRIDAALKALDQSKLSTGPVEQYATRWTTAGQELNAAVQGMQSSLHALTRVPGMGSQSDLEARIAAAQYPQLGVDPAVNRRTYEALQALSDDIQAQMRERVARARGAGLQNTTPVVNPRPANAPPRRARNPQTGEVVELRNGQWVPVR